MTSLMENLERGRSLLQPGERVLLWAMNREITLDDESLDERVEDRVDVHQVAARAGKVLDGRADSGLLGP
ncbi:MAG: hypothetical protein IH884_05315 [Myxococcales bacterium]|nr:hypothetical protein [Myxococcales bacterium]